MSDELHNLREENKRLLDLVNNQGHGLFVADIELKKCKQQLAEATDTLSFLQREYGEADTSTLTRDAIQLKLRLVERERHSLEAELTSTKAALIDAALIHAKLIQERDDLKAKLDAELPAAWREDLVSLNECLDRVSKERDNKNSERIAAEHRAMVAERERDELKSRLAHAEADAEQAIHNEAFNERQRIAEWLRTAPRARGVLISIHSSQDIARCADAIENGEHSV